MIFTDITALYTERVQENTALVQATLRQLKDTIDVSKGTALYDLVVRPFGVLGTLCEENIARARNAGSLLRIAQNPSIADTAMVDELLSNYRMTRRSGTTAIGTVTVSLSSAVVTAVPRGTEFTSGTLSFYTTDSFIGVPEASMVTASTDRVIRSLGNGLYGFEVDVSATSTGGLYRLQQGDVLAMTSPPSNYVSAWATADFTSGSDAETNTELIARMPASLANRTPGNTLNITALIKEQNADVLNVSIIGYGDPEMTRDRNNLFDTGYGGKLDIYTQTDTTPTVQRITKTAVLANVTTKTWQLSLDSDEAAGVYQVQGIRRQDQLATGEKLSVTSEAWSVDGAAATDKHIIISVTQAAFSRYQNITLEFVDPETSTTGLTPMVSTGTYYVDLLTMPGIADLQDDLFNSADYANPRYDDLVKAPVPCLVSVSCTVRLRQGGTFNTQAAKQAIADRINNLGFRRTLSAAFIVDALQGMLPTGSYVLYPVDMLGELIEPADGSSTVYRSSTELTITENATGGVTGNTVMFFCSASNVDIFVQNG